MYIQKIALVDLSLNLGESYIATDEEITQINEYLVIDPKKNYNYWGKRLLKALNTGVISQTVYNAIINNENETKQYYLLNSDIEIDKSTLLGFIERHNIQDIETEGTVEQVLNELNSNNYQIIKTL